MINQVNVTKNSWIQITPLDEGYVNLSLVEFDEEQWELYEEGLSEEWPYEVKDMFSFLDTKSLGEVLIKNKMTLGELKNLLKIVYAIDLDKYL